VIDVNLDSIRIFLHILGASVWVGGQLLMATLVPVLRKISPEAPRQAAAQFGRLAWPFFGLAVITGIWNVFELNLDTVSSGYNAALGIKLLLVAASGGAAAIHSNAGSAAVRGITGAFALLGGLTAMYVGVLLVA